MQRGDLAIRALRRSARSRVRDLGSRAAVRSSDPLLDAAASVVGAAVDGLWRADPRALLRPTEVKLITGFERGMTQAEKRAKALGDVLRRVLDHQVDLADPACSSVDVRERNRALKWLLGFWQLFLRRVTTNRGRHRRPIERRLSQWENREVVQLVAEWRADCADQPPPAARGPRSHEEQVRSVHQRALACAFGLVCTLALTCAFALTGALGLA